VTGKNDAWSIRVKPVGDTLQPGPGFVGHFGNIEERGETGVTPTSALAAYDPATGEQVWYAESEGATNGGNLHQGGEPREFRWIARDGTVSDRLTAPAEYSGRDLAPDADGSRSRVSMSGAAAISGCTISLAAMSDRSHSTVIPLRLSGLQTAKVSCSPPPEAEDPTSSAKC